MITYLVIYKEYYDDENFNNEIIECVSEAQAKDERDYQIKEMGIAQRDIKIYKIAKVVK